MVKAIVMEMLLHAGREVLSKTELATPSLPLLSVSPPSSSPKQTHAVPAPILSEQTCIDLNLIKYGVHNTLV